MIRVNPKVLDFPSMEKDTAQYEAIRRHYLFSGLDEDVFDALAADITVEAYDKGFELTFGRTLVALTGRTILRAELGTKCRNFFDTHGGKIISPGAEYIGQGRREIVV